MNIASKISLGILLTTLSFSSAFAKENKKTTETQTSIITPNSETKKLDEALLLVDIYAKLQQLKSAAPHEISSTKPVLQGLNRALGEVVEFKQSFTPEKKQKIETQLHAVQRDLNKMAEAQSELSKNNLNKVSSSIVDLLKSFLE